MSEPANVAGDSNGDPSRLQTHSVLRAVFVKIVRIVLLVLLVAIIGLGVWLKFTAEGQGVARDLAARWQDFRHGDEARDAAEKLIAMKVQMGTLPPDPTYITLDCTDLQLGDDGFRLIGKCIQLQNLTLIHTDANDERIKCLAGLHRLRSLAIIDSPDVTSAGIRCVALIPELNGLSLIGTGIGDDALQAIGRLSELETLDLSRTRITDVGMPALAGLKKLEWLLLIDTALTDDGVAKLAGLSRLRQIALKGSKVTAKGKEILRQMYPKLTID
jgi:hypothetical protein